MFPEGSLTGRRFHPADWDEQRPAADEEAAGSRATACRQEEVLLRAAEDHIATG